MSDLIKVAVRIRPLLKREIENNCAVHWDAKENRIEGCDSVYTYDHAFGVKCSNRDVYDQSVEHIVKSAMQGYNGTIFAYGQTSSGKTYTIMGEDSGEWGVIPYAVEEIFTAISNSPNREYLLRVTYVEIYMEEIRDLLTGKGDLRIREKQSGEVYIEGIDDDKDCVIVKNSSEILDLLAKGQERRHVGETNMNERSSRSHTIFRIVIESREQQNSENADGAVTVSQLNIVDLAGSERASQTGATGERLKEGAKINQSLSTLARVISQLSEQEDFISFRDSKLTRILQNSLGGNARTCVICTVTPAYIDETQSTLKFASRAKKIKNKPIKNEVLTDEALMKRYQKEIEKLKTQLEEARAQTGLEEIEAKNQIIEEYKEKMEKLQKLILIGAKPPLEKPKSQALKSRRQTWCPGLLSPVPLIAPTPTPQRVRSLAGNLNVFDDNENSFGTMMEEDLRHELAQAEREKEAGFEESGQGSDSEDSEVVVVVNSNRRPAPISNMVDSPGSLAVPKKRHRTVGFAAKLETVAESRRSLVRAREFQDMAIQTDAQEEMPDSQPVEATASESESAKIAELEAEVDALKQGSLEERAVHCEVMEDKKSLIGELQAKVADLEERLTKSEELNGIFEADAAEKEELFENVIRQRDRIEDSVLRLELNLEENECDKEKVVEENVALVSELESKISDLERRLEDSDAVAVEQKESVEQLTVEKDDLLGKIEERNGELQKCLEKAAVLEEQLNEEKDSSEKYQRAIGELEDSVSKLAVTLKVSEESQKSLEEALSEMREFQERNGDLLRADLLKLQSELVESRNDREMVNNELHESRERILALENQIATNEEMKEKELRENLVKVGNLELEIRNLTKKLEETESQGKTSIDMVNTEICESRERVLTLENQLAAKEEEAVKLQNVAEEKISELEGRFLCLQQEDERNMKVAEERISSLEQQVSAFKTVQQDERDIEVEVNSAMEQKLKELNGKIAELQSDNTKLQKQVREGVSEDVQKEIVRDHP